MIITHRFFLRSCLYMKKQMSTTVNYINWVKSFCRAVYLWNIIPYRLCWNVLCKNHGTICSHWLFTAHWFLENGRANQFWVQWIRGERACAALIQVSMQMSFSSLIIDLHLPKFQFLCLKICSKSAIPANSSGSAMKAEHYIRPFPASYFQASTELRRIVPAAS